MTFEYRDDATCDKLVAQPDTDDDRKPVVFLSTSGLNNGVYVPLVRIEEVVAGIRDAARTAARQTTGQDDTCTEDARRPRCHPRHTDDCPYTDPTVGRPDPAVVERFIQHMATQHPAATHCCTNCDGIDPDSCLFSPDRPKDPTAQALTAARRDLHEALVVLPAPEADRVRALVARLEDAARAAVGQPAKAHDTDARPPRVQWRVEGYDADTRYPDVPTRVVRETTTWTVEDER